MISFSFSTISHTHFTVKEVSEQRRELLRQALEEAQAELSRRFEIICEIRAIESLPHVRVRNFDDSEVSEGKHGRHLTFDIPSRWLRLVSCWICCPVSDCRPWAAGRDVPGGAEGAAGSPEGGAANRAAGETGAHPGGEAEQEAAAFGATGHHQPPHESAGTGCCHKVRKMFGLDLIMVSRKMWVWSRYLYKHANITHMFSHVAGKRRGKPGQVFGRRWLGMTQFWLCRRSLKRNSKSAKDWSKLKAGRPNALNRQQHTQKRETQGHTTKWVGILSSLSKLSGLSVYVSVGIFLAWSSFCSICLSLSCSARKAWQWKAGRNWSWA